MTNSGKLVCMRHSYTDIRSSKGEKAKWICIVVLFKLSKEQYKGKNKVSNSHVCKHSVMVVASTRKPLQREQRIYG